MFKLVKLIIFLFVAGSLWYAYQVYWRSPKTNAPTVPIFIEKGQSAAMIAAELAKKGVITYPRLFEWYAKITKKAGALKAGSFTMPAGLSIQDALARLLSSVTSEETITIPEGWDLREIAEYFESKGIAAQKDFFAVSGQVAIDYRRNKTAPQPDNFSNDFVFLKVKPSYVSLEGFLFPDTYRVAKNATLEDVIKKMLGTFQKKIVDVYGSEIDKSGHSLYEIVIVASILEKEVPQVTDRAMVADILWRRLKRGMALQVDSSVNYLTGKEGLFTTADDRQVDSFWNTYKYPGLPLSPISNPGVATIEAALRPKSNSFWFYLTGRDGVVHYGRTLEEHASNRKFL
ncbi:MAG: UPF0755 protein [Candidatus Magasanikbacteria bacterium]|nr:UPF0755 protein [Candidatus Magasanikbacteria bacterium]